MEKADIKRPDVPPAFGISYSLVMMNFRTGIADMNWVEGMAPRPAGVAFTDASEIDGTGIAVMEANTVDVDGIGVAVMEANTVDVDGIGS